MRMTSVVVGFLLLTIFNFVNGDECATLKSSCFLNGSMEGYLTNSEVEERMSSLAALYPHLLSQGRELGRSVNNQSIFAYRLGRRPRPALLVVSMLYARDVSSLATLIYAIETLCRRFTGGEDAELRRALEAVSIVVVPVVNVDAFVDDSRKHKHGGGDTVKNMRPWMPPGGLDDFESALPTAPPDCQQGVNLDRNFPTFWAMQEHSRGACSVEYRGPLPASEPETQALVNLVEQESFRGALIFHSLRGVQYQSQIMYPWFFLQAPSPLTDNERRHYERLAHNMQEAADDEIEFLVGPGARSQFDGDGTLTDYLWGRGIYTLLVTVGVSGTSMAADSQYWPKRHAMAEAAANFFTPIRQWIIDSASEAARNEPGALVLSRWINTYWRDSLIKHVPSAVFIVTMGCCTMLIALVCIARCRARRERGANARAMAAAPPSTPIDEPATLAELGLIKNR
jgi:hypothetical protein